MKVVMLSAVLLVLLLASPADNPGYFAPPDSTIETILNHRDYHWTMERTEHFEVYFEKGTWPAEHIGELKNAAEEARAHALEILQEADYPHGLRVFLVDAREKMTPLIGMHPKGFTFIGRDAVILATNADVRAYMRHEVFHAISIPLWGGPDTWIREGAAVYADGTCFYDDPFRVIPAYLVRTGKHIPLTELLGDFGSIARRSDMLAYMEAGGFVQYLFDTYGADGVKRVWQQGYERMEAIFGKKLDEIEADYLKTLEDVDTSEVDWEMLLEKGCG